MPLAMGLLLIGVPGAILWGVLGAIMRFVPYVGPMMSAVFPLALAFAVDPDWSMFLLTLGLILLLICLNGLFAMSEMALAATNGHRYRGSVRRYYFFDRRFYIRVCSLGAG